MVATRGMTRMGRPLVGRIKDNHTDPTLTMLMELQRELKTLKSTKEINDLKA